MSKKKIQLCWRCAFYRGVVDEMEQFKSASILCGLNNSQIDFSNNCGCNFYVDMWNNWQDIINALMPFIEPNKWSGKNE